MRSDIIVAFGVITCLMYFSEAAQTTAHDMQNVTREWGSGDINIPCFLEDRSGGQTITNTDIYWKKDGKDHVLSYKRLVTYQGANPNVTKLNEDASLSVQNDYSATGVYICDYYSRPHESFIKTRTRVTVTEPPLRVLECNITDANQSTPCRVIVPNGTESLTFTLIKAGLRTTTFDPTLTIDSLDITVEEQTKKTTRNEDNSTTITARYTAYVIDLTSSSNIRFTLTTGLTKEEYVVVLKKAEERGGGGNGGGNGGQTAGIIVGVLVFVVVITIIIAYVIRKKPCQGRHGSASV